MFPHYKAARAIQAERYQIRDLCKRIACDRGMNPWRRRMQVFASRFSARYLYRTSKLRHAAKA